MTNWKTIKEGTLANLPMGEVILFQSECGRYFSVLIHDTSYETDTFEWMYVYTRNIVDSIDIKNFTKYYIPRAENFKELKRPYVVTCPECAEVVTSEELDMFGGLCETCTEEL